MVPALKIKRPESAYDEGVKIISDRSIVTIKVRLTVKALMIVLRVLVICPLLTCLR